MNSHCYKICNFWWFVLKPLLLKTVSYTSLNSSCQILLVRWKHLWPHGHRGRLKDVTLGMSKSWKRKTAHDGLVVFGDHHGPAMVITWLAVMNSHCIPASWHPTTRAEVTSICQRKGWDKFTQETSDTNNLNQRLFPLFLVLKCQEILSQDFHPWMPRVQTSALYWYPKIAIMKSFPATKNTTHCQGKKIN